VHGAGLCMELSRHVSWRPATLYILNSREFRLKTVHITSVILKTASLIESSRVSEPYSVMLTCGSLKSRLYSHPSDMVWETTSALFCPDGLWYNFGGQAISLINCLASARKGCPGCTMVLSVTEEIVPGWTTRKPSQGRGISVHFIMNKSIHIFLIDDSRFFNDNVTSTLYEGEFLRLVLSKGSNMEGEISSVANVGKPYEIMLDDRVYTTFTLLCTQTGRLAPNCANL
jgi:hypothetical protein